MESRKMLLINLLSGQQRRTRGFPDSSVGKESTCSVGDLGSMPGLGRFPWRSDRLPTPVFWPGELHGLYSPWGCKESDMTEGFHSLNGEPDREQTYGHGERGGERG